MPIILATQEAEIRRIAVQSQPRQIVHKILSRKTLSQKNWAGGVAQGEVKPQYHKKKKTLSIRSGVSKLYSGKDWITYFKHWHLNFI
jgi:hypothetical protein